MKSIFNLITAVLILSSTVGCGSSSTQERSGTAQTGVPAKTLAQKLESSDEGIRKQGIEDAVRDQNIPELIEIIYRNLGGPAIEATTAISRIGKPAAAPIMDRFEILDEGPNMFSSYSLAQLLDALNAVGPDSIVEKHRLLKFIEKMELPTNNYEMFIQAAAYKSLATMDKPAFLNAPSTIKPVRTWKGFVMAAGSLKSESLPLAQVILQRLDKSSIMFEREEIEALGAMVPGVVSPTLEALKGSYNLFAMTGRSGPVRADALVLVLETLGAPAVPQLIAALGQTGLEMKDRNYLNSWNGVSEAVGYLSPEKEIIDVLNGSNEVARLNAFRALTLWRNRPSDELIRQTNAAYQRVKERGPQTGTYPMALDGQVVDFSGEQLHQDILDNASLAIKFLAKQSGKHFVQ